MIPRCQVGFFALCMLVGLFWATAAAGDKQDVRHAVELKKEAQGLLEQARFVEAAGVCRRMLESCGEHQLCCGAAMFYLARCRLEQAEFQKAEELLEKAHEIFSGLGDANRYGSVLLTKARLFALRGLYRESLKCMEEARKLFQQPGNKGELFVLLSSQAAVHAYMSDYDQALKCLDEAQKLGDSHAGGRRKALLANNRGLVFAARHDYAKASDLYENALEDYRQADDPKGMAVVLNNLGQLHEAQSAYSQAMAMLKRSLELARKAQAPVSEALALNNLGGVYLKTGDYQAALQSYEEALEIRTRLGMRHFAAETLNNLGLVHLNAGDYARALEHFTKASATCREVGSLSCQAWASHNMAFLFRDQGEFPKSVDYSRNAIRLARKMGDRRLQATATLRLGNICEYQGLFEMALQSYKQAADLQRKVQDWYFLSNTWADMANIDVRNGNFDQSNQYYEKAIRLRKKIGAPYGDFLAKHALFYLERRNYGIMPGDLTPDEEMAEARRIIAEAEPIVNPENLNDFLLLGYVKGKLLLESDPEKAVEEFEIIKALVEGSPNKKYRFLAEVGLGLAYERLERWARAEQAFRAAKEYSEEIRTSLEPHARIAFLNGEEILGIKHIVPYEGLARVLLRRGDEAGSLREAEYTKARSFAEKLAMKSRSVSFGVPDAVVAHDEELHNRLAALKRCLAKARQEKNPRAEAIAMRKSKIWEAKLRGHIARLRIEYPLFAATKYPQPITLEESGLKEPEWVICYDVTDSAVLIYLIHGRTIVKTIFRQVPRSHVDGLVRRFRQPTHVSGDRDLNAMLTSFDFSAGKALADLLVGDLLSELPEKQPVIIVPDDSLGILSFETLVLNSGGTVKTDRYPPYVDGAEFFGDRNPISYYQSITALTLMRTQGTLAPPGKRVLIVADPVFHVSDERASNLARVASKGNMRHTTVKLMSSLVLAPNVRLPRLELTGRLAQSLPPLFDGRADVFTGLDASKETLLRKIRPRLHEYGMIVVGTHGFFDDQRSGIREPLLFLSLVPPGTDGIVTMTDVLGLQLNAEVVALVACQTGLGKRISGEGTMGMGRAFQYGGSRAVLATLWSVAEDSSVTLVESFFRHLKTEENKLEALVQARRDIRNRGYDHPFFWGPFVLMGEVESHAGSID